MSEKKQEGHGELSALDGAVAVLASTTKPGALKAFSYLLGGMGAYVGALLRRPGQQVEDGTDARTLVTTALARAAADRLASDPSYIQAAIEEYAPAAVQRKVNKAKISARAYETLLLEERDSVGDDEGTVSDEFLLSFDRMSEDASSEKMQEIWGRLLAGEIKTPGKFRRSTMRVLSDLDQVVANRFAEICDYEFEGALLVPGDESSTTADHIELEAAGLIKGAGGILSWSLQFDQAGVGAVRSGCFSLLLRGEPNYKHAFDAFALTRAGVELSSLVQGLPCEDKLKRLAERFRDTAVRGATLCGCESEGRLLKHTKREHLWGEGVI